MRISDKKMNAISKQIEIVERKEERLLKHKEPNIIREKLNPLRNKVERMIPDKLQKTLEKAFYKGFSLVFEKGIPYIEKTYDKDKIILEHDINHYAVERCPSRKYLKRVDKTSVKSNLLNSSIAVVEGSVLGLLGIGLPDIPLFLAVILKTVNEVALSYGYSYDTKDEQRYILYLISGAISEGEEKKYYMEMADETALNIDQGIFEVCDLKEAMEETSDHLAQALLMAKFIQGIPLVGVIGGAVNHSIIQKVGYYARVKYKKRYLAKQLRELIEG